MNVPYTFNVILGRKENNLHIQDDYPISVPDFNNYRIIIRCSLKLKTCLTAVFKRMDIQVVREAAIKDARTPNGPWLPKNFINTISLVEASDELFDVLIHNQHLDWINFSVVESMVKHSKSELAAKVLANYKSYTLQLPFLRVFTVNTRVPRIDEPGPDYAKVKEILSTDINRMTVGDLLEHKAFLEKNIFCINQDSTRVGGIDNISWEVVWIIPMECCYHVYHCANSNVHKFDNITSLEIEDYPIIKKSVEFSIDRPLCEFLCV